MNNEEENAKRLWQHLKIQDEHLIIRTGSSDNNTEKVIIVDDEGDGRLHISHIDIPTSGFKKWIEEYGRPFTLVQQRDENGKFIIPDIDEWIRDEEIDY